MLDFLYHNWGNILVGAFLTAAAVFSIIKIIRSRKTGKGCCGDCSKCGGCSSRKDK